MPDASRADSATTKTPTIALSMVPGGAAGRPHVPTGVLKFYYGPMDCGKSTLALQVDYNHSRQGRRGLLLTKLDRSRTGQITSRMGIVRQALEVDDTMDVAELVSKSWAQGHRVDYLVVDEAQFFTTDQIDQLALLVDDIAVDVYAFGIATDFRGRMFPGSKRLFELADEVLPLQVEVLCWCGRPGRFNGRVVGGVLVREGETIVVADMVVADTVVADAAFTDTVVADTMATGTVVDETTDAGTVRPADQVRYQVLCRTHHRNGDLGPGTDQRALPLVGSDPPVR